MPAYNYVTQFTDLIQKKYMHELKSYALTQSNPQVKFINAQTIKLPKLTTTGYKDHSRTPGFNAGTVANDWEAKRLEFDRDVEFWIDPLDIDETNLVLSMANIQNTFEETQAIPEKDCYRFSKLHAELTRLSGTIDETVLTPANILAKFDELMEAMDEAGVPESGRIIYATPTYRTMLKQADEVQRTIIVANGGNNGVINRKVHSLDDVEIIMVPSDRMKTAYDFTTGFTPAVGAKQINMILIHPSCQVCRDQYSYINVFTPGTDSRTADGYLYQNRNFGDLFLLDMKKEGCAMNVEA